MRFTTRILGSAAGVFLALMLGLAAWAGTAASAVGDRWVGDNGTHWIQFSLGVPGPSGSFPGGSIMADANTANLLAAAATTTGGIDACVNGTKETVAAGGGVTYASPPWHPQLVAKG